MKEKRLRGSLVVGLFLVSCAVAAEPVTVAVPPLDSLLEEDGQGVYQRLMDRALEALGTEVRQYYYPYRRSLQAFEAGQVDCLFSFTDVLLQQHDRDDIVYSYPLGKFRFHIFTRADEAPLRSLEELEGLVVGSVMGHDVYLDLVEGLELPLEVARSDFHGVRMLRAGRLDALIAAVPDISPYLDQLSHDPDSPLLESHDRLNCHNTERNRDFLKALSAELARLREQGVYEEEAGDLYVPFCEGDGNEC